jgi:hypothetical protein
MVQWLGFPVGARDSVGSCPVGAGYPLSFIQLELDVLYCDIQLELDVRLINRSIKA